MNEILQVATLAGKIILENGGETYRVEETIWRICKTFGAENAESYVTPTGMISSITHQGQLYSITRRINNRTVDLDKIHRVNDLSRSIVSQKLTVSEFKKELLLIDEGERYPFWQTLFFSALAAGAFTSAFNGTLKDMFSAFLIGLLIRLITVKGSEYKINFFFINAIAGGVTAFCAISFYKLGIASNINSTIIGSIMLLVPGLAITNAIRDTIAGDLIAGLTRACEAVLIAISIAVGTGGVLSFWITYLGGV